MSSEEQRWARGPQGDRKREGGVHSPTCRCQQCWEQGRWQDIDAREAGYLLDRANGNLRAAQQRIAELEAERDEARQAFIDAGRTNSDAVAVAIAADKRAVEAEQRGFERCHAGVLRKLDVLIAIKMPHDPVESMEARVLVVAREAIRQLAKPSEQQRIDVDAPVAGICSGDQPEPSECLHLNADLHEDGWHCNNCGYVVQPGVAAPKEPA